MKKSLWVKTASFFVDILLEKQKSEYSGSLEVICRKGRYALCTDNAVYSYDDLYHNFRDVFCKIKLNELDIKNVLVLGLGLGSVPLLLEKTFLKNYTYTLVEIDPVVVGLAKKYTLSNLQSPLNVVCADALEFVKSCKQKFDMIAVDIFIDDQVPSVFESVDFLQNVKLLLSPDALLLYNRLAYNESLEHRTQQFFDAEFNLVFQNAVILPVSGNKMFLNRPL